MKNAGILLFVSLLSFAVLGGVEALNVTAETNTVYVSSTGEDGNAGTEALPYRTLERALEKVENGGKIVLQDSVSIDAWTSHGKTVTVTGGSLDATDLTSLQINDNVTFVDVEILVHESEYICANGYTVVMGEGVSLSNAIDVFGGGDSGTRVAGMNLTLLSGRYKNVYGGSRRGTVDGDTHLTVGGTVNEGLDVSDHSLLKFFYGGGNADTITGSTYLTFGENARAIHLFGGSIGSGSTIGGNTNLTVTGGLSMSIYGANKGVTMQCDANTKITGGTFEQVFGGSESADLTGDVNLRVLGGTVTRRIYGGCYNETSSLSFSTSYSVNGNIGLTLGSGVSITYGYDGSDLSVYAHSRYGSNTSSENANLIFADQTIYERYVNGTLKLTAQDLAMKIFVGSLSVADAIHYYTYFAEENVITQTCAYHTGLSATATVNVDHNALAYTGEEITPVNVTYGDDWEYDPLNCSYKNNVEEGTATYTVGAENTLLTGTFEIRKAPTVLGGSVRLSTPAGLRFQSKVQEDLVDEGAIFGTLVIPKAVLGENALTCETASVCNIPQTKWATDSVKRNNPDVYEEGYVYFNAALTDIPEAYYGEVIVACSYAYLNGIYYYSAPIERSLAQVAAYALQDGYTQEALYTYVDTALSGETLSMESEIEVVEGEHYQLSITGNKGYVAVWQSSDESIAKVDKNGLVTGLEPGTVTVTAKIGNTVIECVVVVEGNWTGLY